MAKHFNYSVRIGDELINGAGTLDEIKDRLKTVGHSYELNDWPEGKEMKHGDQVAVIKDAQGEESGYVEFAGEA
jgi:hypothetical protein